MRYVTLALVALLLTGCDNFDNGDKVRAYAQKDPTDPCRIVLQVTIKAGEIRYMTARIEGCSPRS